MGTRAWFTGTAVMAAISLLLPAAAPAQTSRAGVVTTLHGTATVARTSTPEPRPLKFRDDVFVQDRITTGEESIARILLGGKAVVTIRERSNLTITETATSSTIEMTSGKIALSVDKSRVKSGESVEIKTPNAVAAIRGTIIVAEVDPPSAQSPDVTTRFTLLTGVVDVTRVDPTGKLSGAAVVMKPMQALGVTGFAAAPLAAPRPITRVEADTMASGFSARLPEPAPSTNGKLMDDQVKEAAKATAAVVNKTKTAVKDLKDSSTNTVGSVTPTGSTTTGGSSGSLGGTVSGVTGSTGITTPTIGTVTTATTGGLGTVGTLTSGTVGGTGSLTGSGSTLIGTVVDKLPKDKLKKDLKP